MAVLYLRTFGPYDALDVAENDESFRSILPQQSYLHRTLAACFIENHFVGTVDPATKRVWLHAFVEDHLWNLPLAVDDGPFRSDGRHVGQSSIGEK
jgi:hypothetical protein